MLDRQVKVHAEINGQQVNTSYKVHDKLKLAVIINNQFTNAPNTTQLASGAGRSSTSGNNVAIASSNTEQQQSVGAQGEAQNEGMKGKQLQPQDKNSYWDDGDEIVFVINNQIHCNDADQAAATQVASGGGMYSAAGTNAAVESSNTKQQHAVGGSGQAFNKGMNSTQIEKPQSFHHKQQRSIDGLKLFID